MQEYLIPGQKEIINRVHACSMLSKMNAVFDLMHACLYGFKEKASLDAQLVGELKDFRYLFITRVRDHVRINVSAFFLMENLKSHASGASNCQRTTQLAVKLVEEGRIE